VGPEGLARGEWRVEAVGATPDMAMTVPGYIRSHWRASRSRPRHRHGEGSPRLHRSAWSVHASTRSRAGFRRSSPARSAPRAGPCRPLAAATLLPLHLLPVRRRVSRATAG